jgi:hypothetical protein
MFDYQKWCATGFVFERDGMKFIKSEGTPHYQVDDTYHEVYDDDQGSQETPALIMWLIEGNLIDPD